jgi:hypothetical protein
MYRSDTRPKNFRGTIQIHEVHQRIEHIWELHPSLLSTIFAFAAANDRATISVEIASFEYHTSTGLQAFMCFGWTIEAALGKFKKRRFPGHKKALTSWQQAKQGMENTGLGNLSFFADWSMFNEKDFRRLLRTTKDRFIKKYILPTYGGEEDEVVKAVKGWVEKGIPATTVLREEEQK